MLLEIPIFIVKNADGVQTLMVVSGTLIIGHIQAVLDMPFMSLVNEVLTESIGGRVLVGNQWIESPMSREVIFSRIHEVIAANQQSNRPRLFLPT